MRRMFLAGWVVSLLLVASVSIAEEVTVYFNLAPVGLEDEEGFLQDVYVGGAAPHGSFSFDADAPGTPIFYLGFPAMFYALDHFEVEIGLLAQRSAADDAGYILVVNDAGIGGEDVTDGYLVSSGGEPNLVGFDTTIFGPAGFDLDHTMLASDDLLRLPPNPADVDLPIPGAFVVGLTGCPSWMSCDRSFSLYYGVSSFSLVPPPPPVPVTFDLAGTFADGSPFTGSYTFAPRAPDSLAVPASSPLPAGGTRAVYRSSGCPFGLRFETADLTCASEDVQIGVIDEHLQFTPTIELIDEYSAAGVGGSLRCSRGGAELPDEIVLGVSLLAAAPSSAVEGVVLPLEPPSLAAFDDVTLGLHNLSTGTLQVGTLESLTLGQTPDADHDGLFDCQEAAFGGRGVTIDNPTGQNRAVESLQPDGTTRIASGDAVVILPPGAQAESASTEIQIQVVADPGGDPGATPPRAAISGVSLPEGTSKTVDLIVGESGAAGTADSVCIDDRTDADIEALAGGNCTGQRIELAIPDQEGASNILRTAASIYRVTRLADGWVRIEGLLHTAVAAVRDADTDGVRDADDACPEDPGTETNAGCPEVAIDIKPGSDPNAVNLHAPGVVAVALLGSADSTIENVAQSSLRFGPAGAQLADRDGGGVEDVDGDGYLDLVGHFRIRETGIEVGDLQACLLGEMLSGESFRGCDGVLTVPPH
jgi:hypothetical protein